MKQFLLPILVIFLFSCSSVQLNKSNQKDLEEKWLGKNDTNIVAKYGIPKKVLTDSLNGKIYIYEDIQMDYSRQRDTTINGNTNCKIYKAITKTAIFHFNNINKITKICYSETDTSKGEFLAIKSNFKQIN